MLALEKFVMAKVVHGAMLCRGHEPGAGIVWNAGPGPAFECGDQSVLSEFFSKANVANDARESGNNFGGLDSPDSVDDTMSGGGFDLRGHGDPFQLVKQSDYEKNFTSERGAASSRGADVRSRPRLKVLDQEAAALPVATRGCRDSGVPCPASKSWRSSHSPSPAMRIKLFTCSM